MIGRGKSEGGSRKFYPTRLNGAGGSYLLTSNIEEKKDREDKVSDPPVIKNSNIVHYETALFTVLRTGMKIDCNLRRKIFFFFF